MFVIFGGLVALALIAALVAPYFINWSVYRDQFEREASRLLGQPVTVAGDATARLLPFPKVTFEEVRVGGPDAPVLVADRFSMDAELAPFLRGEVLIYDMRVENPRMTVRLGENGLPVWPIAAGGPVSPARVTLEKARIVNGSIELADEAAGRTWMLTGLDATVSAQSLYGPFRLDGDARLNGMPLNLRLSTGNLSKEGFGLRTVLDLPRQEIEITADGRIAEPDDGQTGPYAGTFAIRPRSGEAPRYLVEGDFTASPRTLDIQQYRAEFGEADDPYIVTGSAGISGGTDPRYRLDVRGNQITFPEETVEEDGEATAGADFATVAERLAVARSALTALPFPPIPGSIDIDLPAVIAGGTTIRDIRVIASPNDQDGEASERSWKLSRLEAQLPGRTKVEADGVLRLPVSDDGEGGDGTRFAGNLVLASQQPSGLAVWLTGSADEAVRKLDAAGFAAKVEITPLRQTVEDLEVILGPARLRGSLERVSDPVRRSTLDVTLGGDELDYATLEALAIVFVGEDGVRRFADQDVDLALKLTSPEIRGVRLASLDASIRSRGAKTEIDRLSMTGLYGASVSATASLERREDGVRGTLDTTIFAMNGAELLTGLAQRFPSVEMIGAAGAVAARNPDAFSETRLDVVGTVDQKAELSGEASLSVSGASGGTGISFTSTATGSLSDAEKIRVMVDAGFVNGDAETLLRQTGLEAITLDGLGGLYARLSANGSLFDGMKSTFSVEGNDMFAQLNGVLTSDILSTGFTGTGTVEARDIEPWVMALGYSLPGMGLGTATDLTAAVSHRGGKTVLHQVEAIFDGNRVRGDLTVDRNGGVPAVRGDLALDYLNAVRLYDIVTGKPGDLGLGGGEGADKRRFAAPYLSLHDIAIGLRAEEVALPAGATLKALSGDFTYAAGAMALKEFEGRFAGGHVGGRVELQNTGGELIASGQIAMSGVEAASLLPSIDGVISGKGDLTLQVTGSGRTTGAVVSSIAGSGVLSTGPLEVAGIRADGFAPMVAEADAIGYEISASEIEALAEAAFLTGRVTLPAADYPIRLSDGIARITNAAISTGPLSISADASLDLKSGAISGNARLGYDPGEESVAGPQPEVSLSFQAADGGFSVERDFAAVTGYLTQRALEQEQARVEALQARLLEKQRLRREVQYLRYRTNAWIRAREEARLRAIAAERAERLANDAAVPPEAEDAEEDALLLQEPKSTSPSAIPKVSKPSIEIQRLLDVLPEAPGTGNGTPQFRFGQ
ncbi:AsmA family protein [Oricola cellulosilytica]|uniref:AsmA family protein n=1 Tax=Oricola cellulosilytica TaxID=1429082 RepID=A0A4R0PEY7_9HYPH|nr:AsmA family protein [Oricola cellulosilytica]TCD15208.1 AsmA family protein [Oricola cellulosilytica]